MVETLREIKSDSEKEFEKLLTEDLNGRKLTEGQIVKAEVSAISKKHVFVDIAAKSEGMIPIEEFKLTQELDKIKVGSKIDVFLERLENITGNIVVSREKARKAHTWKKMEKAFESKELVTGYVVSRCKGGFVVDVDSCLCFLPGSQVDLKPLKNTDHIIKTKQTFECVKLDKKRGNIVLSRRAILEKAREKDRQEILSKIKEGDIVEGICKNITEWGAFLDINGIDALLHITDISWSRINKPSELLSIGQSVRVKITKIDPETKKISVGIKQLTEDPYEKSLHKYEIGKNYKAKVSKVMEYGCFARLEDGLEGLIHQSEMSWIQKNPQPGKILSVSQEIKVKVLEKDLEKRRISLSYKATLDNPWTQFTKKFSTNTEAEGVVKNVTEYGLFVSINNTDLSGMVHFKDLSWSEEESELKKYNKNSPIKFKILEINEEKERIRLGVKQLTNDPFDFFKNKNKSDIITVTVKDQSINGIKVSAGKEGLTFLIKKNQLAKAVEDARPSRFARGDKIDVMITELDLEKRKVSMSIKALEEKMTKEAVKKYGSEDSGASLGEILGPILKGKKKK